MTDVEPVIKPRGAQVQMMPWPAAVSVHSMADRRVVAAIWSQIELLLSSGAADVHASLRQLAASLPPLQEVPTPELPALAHLHLHSAGQLMATIRLLAPDAFKAGASEPDMAALVAVSNPAAHMIGSLIDLQLFHLARAKDATATLRERIALRQQQSPSVQVTCSSGSSCEELTLVQSLE